MEVFASNSTLTPRHHKRNSRSRLNSVTPYVTPGRRQATAPTYACALINTHQSQARSLSAADADHHHMHYTRGQNLFDTPTLLNELEDSLSESDFGDDTSGDTMRTPSSSTQLPALRDISNQHHSQVTPSRHQLSAINGQEVNLISLLQQQQKMLTKIFNQQESMENKQKHFEEKILDVEIKLQEFSSSSSSSSTEKKCRLPRKLTKKVASIHDALEEGFDPTESSLTDKNKGIKQYITSQISQETDCSFSLAQITAAVQRKYEGMRRQSLIDTRDNGDEAMLQTSKKKKYRSRRHRKFSNRASVVQESERWIWEQIKVEYMTEESDDPEDSGGIIEHKLIWRSKRFCDFLVVLDRRYNVKARQDGQMAKKNRKVGSPCSTSLPYGTPTWMVAEQFRESATSLQQDSLEIESGIAE